MIKFFNIKYSDLSKENSEEIYSLRKTVFKDRLNWAVSCTGNLEFDQYDTPNTTYIVGVYNNVVLCSLRFIETKYPTMITGTFLPFFKEVNLPVDNYIEASRFFIDKNKVKELKLSNKPLCTMFFLVMIRYSMNFNYDGIYAIVSHSMLTVIKNSGWLISIVEEGRSEKTEKVYLIFMPTDQKNHQLLIDNLRYKTELKDANNMLWPITYTL